MAGKKIPSLFCRRLHIENLEDRITPSWGDPPPFFITVPTNFTTLTLNGQGDATRNASITNNEVDWFRISVRSGQTNIAVSTPSSNLDSVAGLYNANGELVAYNDDFFFPFVTDSAFSVNLPTGTYYLGVTNYFGSPNGSYTLNVDAPTPPTTPPPPPTTLPRLSITALAADRSEGNSSFTPYTFNVTRSGSTSTTSQVSYSVVGNGSFPTNTTDFGGAFPSGTVNFAAGQTTATITVFVRGDRSIETDESFSIRITNPVNATLQTSTSTGRVRNDDVAVSPPPVTPPPVTPPPVTPPPVTPGGFDIDVRVSGLTASQTAIFEQAAQRWERVIRGDLPNAVLNGVTIDDLQISASGRFIDGAGGILGQAGPTALRSGSRLPYAGIMEFDTADLASLEASGGLLSVILHEMGHVIGIGTIWSSLGLLSGAGTSNPRFTGTQATTAYNQIFGTNASGVPVENSGGGGTRDSHWSDALFGNELMTGYLSNGSNPLSRVTVGSLADLGYVVDFSAADAYTPNGGNVSGGGGNGGGGASLFADPNDGPCGCPLCRSMLNTIPVVDASNIVAADWESETQETPSIFTSDTGCSLVEARADVINTNPQADRTTTQDAASRLLTSTTPTANCPFNTTDLSVAVG